MMLNKLMRKRSLQANEQGFTASEMVIVIGVLGAVAYLVLPLVFPGDLLTSAQKAEKDLTRISQIIDERERISALNDALDSVAIGNLGVYASHGEVTFNIEIDEGANEINYCLIGLFDGTTYYADSYTTGVSTTPVGYCVPDSEPDENATPDGVEELEENSGPPESAEDSNEDLVDIDE
jgi:type II secretory pathway pseudopilin PulG